MQNEYEITHRKLALGAVQQFLEAPDNAESVRGIVDASRIGGILHAKLEASQATLKVVTFSFHDPAAKLWTVRCNPASFALLLCTIILDQSIMLNDAIADGVPFLKVCGRMSVNAGIVFARVLAEAMTGDQVRYRNGDHLDLCHDNLRISERSKKTVPPKEEPKAQMLDDSKERVTILFYAETLRTAMLDENSPLSGTKHERPKLANALLDVARQRVWEERNTITDGVE